jgi:triphosphoribosyl-dephospho-CoA synthase
MRLTLSHSPRASDAAAIGRCVVRSLYAELVLYPKPGLVSLRDSGAHEDMDARTFLKSLFALRRFFVEVAGAGADGASFARLRELGIAAESRMLRATGGINTHRGAIFVLGLLAAAAGACGARGDLRDTLLGLWGRELRAMRVPRDAPPSHGRWVASRYGVAGARGEAAEGFPSVFEAGLPALRGALLRGTTMEAAQVQAFFTLLHCVHDSNVLYRGGERGAIFARDAARDFLERGGVFARDWKRSAVSLHRAFVLRGLSPGGCADLLAATLFVHALQSP